MLYIDVMRERQTKIPWIEGDASANERTVPEPRVEIEGQKGNIPMKMQ